MLVLGALCSFLEPFCGHLSPKIDKVSEELTLRHPHEGPWVDRLHKGLLKNLLSSQLLNPLLSRQFPFPGGLISTFTSKHSRRSCMDPWLDRNTQ